MKQIALALTVFLSLMTPSTSHAGWVKVTEGVRGDIYYIDTKIRKHDGLIYYWRLDDYLKPDKTGVLSAKVYYEGDCRKFRHRRLQDSYHTQPMGRGSSKYGAGAVLDDPWGTPFPGSVGVLEKACEMAN
jgi:hypothetical protein